MPFSAAIRDGNDLRRLAGHHRIAVRRVRSIEDPIDALIAAISACLIAVTAILLLAPDRTFRLDRLFVGTGKG